MDSRARVVAALCISASHDTPDHPTPRRDASSRSRTCAAEISRLLQPRLIVLPAGLPVHPSPSSDLASSHCQDIADGFEALAP